MRIRQAVPFLLLSSFAGVFWFLFYRTAHATLMWSEGVGSWLPAFLFAITAAAFLLLDAFLQRASRIGPLAFLRVGMDLAIFLALAAVIPYLLVRLPPAIEQGTRSSISFLWLPIEWHKYPKNIGLITGSNIGVAFALAAGLALLLAGLVFRHARKRVAASCAVMTVVLLAQLGHKDMGFRAPFFQLVLAGPWVLLTAAAWLGWKRAFARLSLPAWSQGLLCLFYTGLLPMEEARFRRLPEGVDVFYPQQGRPADFPLQYVREIYVDPNLQALFASYGPTSGLIRMELSSGRTQILPTAGLIRGLWSEDSSPYLYAIEWIYDDLWIVDKRDFRVARKQRLMDGVLVAPIDIFLNESRIFVVSTEYPALTAFDRHSLEKTGQINFRDAGLTAFRSGAWVGAYDPETRSIFVELGMTDLSDRFSLVKLAADDLRILQSQEIPFGGLQMVAVPAHRSLLISDFYSDRVAEIDMDTLEIRRVLSAVVNTRSLAYVPGDNVILAASFMTGQFKALRYATGEPITRMMAGKKPSQIFISPHEEAAYFASMRGFMRFPLNLFRPVQ